MCTIADDGTIRPCGGLWPEGSHEAAWHPHANCPTCSTEAEAALFDLATWLVAHGPKRASWSELAEKLLKDFRVLRKETK